MREYTYLQLKFYDYNKLGSTSSIANAVNSKIIKNMPMLIADNETILSFHRKTKPMFDQIKIKSQENRELSELRDYLLPKLMSGKLRINDLNSNTYGRK
jgi:hypothetical protein